MEVTELATNMKESAEQEEFLSVLEVGKRKMWYSRTFLLFNA